MKSKTSPKKPKKKVKTSDIEKMTELLKERFGPNVRIIGMHLPDPAKVGVEKFQAAAERAIKAKLKEEVNACSKALFDRAIEWPMPVALQALENVFVMAIQSLGSKESKCLQSHLEKFHAEITMLNVEGGSSTIH